MMEKFKINKLFYKFYVFSFGFFVNKKAITILFIYTKIFNFIK